MKKIIGFLTMATVLIATSCTDEKKEVKKEVIVVPASPTIIIKDPPAKSTTISLDKDGIKVETKKVKVKIDNK